MNQYRFLVTLRDDVHYKRVLTAPKDSPSVRAPQRGAKRVARGQRPAGRAAVGGSRNFCRALQGSQYHPRKRVGRVVRFSAARVRGWDMMFDAHPLANAGGTDSYELLFLRQPQEALRSRQKRVDVPLRR